MCGIAGIFNTNLAPVDPSTLEHMRRMLQHRGPDDYGIWHNNYIGFSHNRLSIIDLSPAGHQPFFSDDRRFVMVYNGEVYNFAEVRKWYESKGISFSTRTDTEVILKGYIFEGAQCLNRFNGMFAFAIWDHQERKLFIARDRAGVKPLYYFLNEQQFIFASEPKAIFAAGIPHDIHEENLDEWLVYRSVSGENTLYKNIKRLLPGHYAELKADQALNTVRWWNLGEKVLNHSQIQHPFEWFEETFYSSLKYRMVSDVKVGVLLSGGLDSCSLTAGLKKSGYEHINTFNVAFKDKMHDESALAEKFSNETEFPFHKIYPEEMDMFDLAEQAGYFADRPLMHMNDPQLLSMAQFANSKVSVLLSGEGSDEILGGYVRYKVFEHPRLWPYYKNLAFWIQQISHNPRFEKMYDYLKTKNKDLMIMSNGNNVFPLDFIDKYGIYGISLLPEYRIKMVEEAKQVYPDSPIRQLLYYEQHTYLQTLNDRNDHATMGASIECREPFMDYRIMEGIGSLDTSLLFKGKRNKYILTNTLGKLLPEYITHNRKIGFSVPWSKFFIQQPKFRETLEHLEQCEIFKIASFSKLDIRSIKYEFLKYGQHKPLISQLVFLSIWFNSYGKRLNEQIRLAHD